MTFAHPLPWWGLGLALAAAALVAWSAYRRFDGHASRRFTLSALRLLTLLVLLFFLMRPVVRSQPAGREAVVPVLVDTSRSMSLQDADGLRRIDRARQILEARLQPALREQYEVEVLAFGDELSEAPVDGLAATAPRSDLAGALTAVRERYRGQPVAGVVLLTDGGDTSAAAERSAAALGLPLYPIGIGADRVDGDVEVLSVTSAESVADGSQVDIAASAVAHGTGQTAVELRLLENGRAIQIARVTPAAEGSPVHHVFRVSPASGAPTIYTVEAPTAAADPVPENNRRSVLVQGLPRPRRILFVEGAPGFEHSFLKRAWAGDRSLEVDAVARKGTDERGRDTFYVQAARSRADQLTSGYPTTPEALFAYDAVVLANIEADRLETRQLEWTRDFVARRGGGLLVLGGRTFERPGLAGTPLEDVLPLFLDSRADALAAARTSAANQASLTVEGREHPVTRLGADGEAAENAWQALPPLASLAELGGPRPGATVLAVAASGTGVTRALAAVQRYGEGRTLIFTGEGAWRWRMQRPASDRAYDTFWRQAVRWLAVPSPEPVRLSLPPDAAAGATTRLSVAVYDAAFMPVPEAVVEVRVRRPDGGAETLRAAPSSDTPGLYSVSYRPPGDGVYEIEAAVSGAAEGRVSAPLLVGGSDLEMTDPRRHGDLLQRLAAASGGRAVAEDGEDELARALAARVPAAFSAATRDLWHTGWSFALVLALLGSEWLLRRRWGLR